MSLIEEVSKRCFKFYGPDGFTSNGVLKVITLIQDVIVNSRSTDDKDDLKYMAVGMVSAHIGRIEKGGAQGYSRLRSNPEQREIAIREFVEYFYDEVFMKDYNGERGSLRQARNRFNAGINAWYQANWRQFQTKKAKEDTNADN